MDLSEFNYELPSELIATHPVPRRDTSRLMVVRMDGAPFAHRCFQDLPELLQPGDCLVLNDSRVWPARLFARRPGGGRVELLLLEPVTPGVWQVLARPARKLQPGMRLELPGGGGEGVVLPGGDDRTRLIRLELNEDLDAYLQRHGETPLPPYILREREARGETTVETAEDRERYQTVYALPPGSVAAPTAGLHFTSGLLETIRTRGIEVRRLTLHVGIGTFQPITAKDTDDHVMHEEHYEIGEQDAEAIEQARRDPARRVVAVGTTTVRALESCFASQGRIVPTRGSTRLLITPGFKFGVTRALVTNFHLPGSTLMLLVAALAGRERILEAYRLAIAERYRFYSYGDAMLIE